MRQTMTALQLLELRNYEGNDVIMPKLTPNDLKKIRQQLDRRGFKSQKKPDVKDGIDFSFTAFSKTVFFSDFIFVSRADFLLSEFGGSAYFQNAIFVETADFQEVLFSKLADFHKVVFNNFSEFQKAKFKRSAFFHKAKFVEPDFELAIFYYYAYFQETVFSYRASFVSTTFLLNANFQRAVFDNYASFSQAKFLSKPDFKSAIFKTTTEFEKAEFTNTPPEFFDASLSEDTNWNNVIWPKTPNKEQANNHIRAYERLALIMNQQQKHHDHHTFFRLEMRARRVNENKFSARAMNWFYEKTCGYGYGFTRALGLWLLNIFIGFVLMLPNSSPSGVKFFAHLTNTFAISFANCHSFLGLNRGALKGVYKNFEAESYSTIVPFHFVWTVQALLGIIRSYSSSL